MSIKLYHAPGSCAFAALAALEQAGADYDAARLDLAAGDQKTAAFRTLNPLGRVPVMIAQGRPITETIAVLTYIAAKFPDARLATTGDPLTLAREYELLTWFSTSMHLHMAQMFRGDRFGDGAEFLATLKENGRRRFAENLLQLEAFCAATDSVYTAGRFRLTNAFGLVIWRWAKRLELDTSAMPAWTTVIESDLALPAVERASARETSSPKWLQEAAE